MKDRIAQIIKNKNFTSAQFADTIGLQRSVLTHITSGRNGVSTDVIMKIHAAFPEISINWLIFGEGNMFLEENRESHAIDNIYATDLPIASISDTSINPITDQLTPKSLSMDYGKKNLTTKTEDTAIKYNSITSPSTPMQSTLNERKITKIMVFYSDNTFESFNKECLE